MFKKISYLFFILFLASLVSACSLPWQKSDKSISVPLEVEERVRELNNLQEPELSSGDLKKFSDYQELRGFLLARNHEYQQKYRQSIGMMPINTTFDLSSQAESLSSPVSDGALADDYSRTNVQVAGVDEADIIKTDGEYIYALVYNDVYVIKARPAEQARALTKLSFPSRPSEMYIDNGVLVVMGQDRQIIETSVYQKFHRQSPYTFVRVFDVSNPEEPKSVRSLSFEGSYQDSRLIDGRLYMVINNYSHYLTGETAIPRLVDNDRFLSSDCNNNDLCFAPNVYYFDVPYESYQLTSINTLDLRTNNEPVESQAYLLSGSQNIYVSADNIFITHTEYLNEIDVRVVVLKDLLFDRLSVSEQDLLLEIESLSSLILSQSEKKQKIMQLFQRFLDSKASSERSSLDAEIEAAMKKKYEDESANWERTLIYKFDLNDGSPIYRAKGSVPGTVLNQFSLDEDASGRLRIATTRSRNFNFLGQSQESYSNLYILTADLKILGAVENLAPGERIYSVRFMGNRAYMVTFRQIDPLFVIDLSNPQDPKVLGELKIPGFSSYLHPYDEHTLIGLGRDVQVDVYGNTKNGGVKLSLFDVSDPSNPLEVDNYIAGESGSDSLAIHNHKAFLFSRDKNLLLIPASLTSVGSPYRPYFSGALIFSIDNQKFNLRGEIDHSDGGRYLKSDHWCGFRCYDNSVQRGLYIQDYLYTFSNKYLKINHLSDLSAVQDIKLLPDTDADLSLPPLRPEPIIIDPVEPGDDFDNIILPIGPVVPANPTVPVDENFYIGEESDLAEDLDSVDMDSPELTNDIISEEEESYNTADPGEPEYDFETLLDEESDDENVEDEDLLIE